MNTNEIIIDITINDLEDVTNRFNSKKLSDELSNYIYNECKGNSLKDNIKINIHTLRELTDDEKEKIVDMIRSNYGIDIKENMLYIKYTNIKGIILFIVGIFLICIYNFLNNFELSWIPETLLIISWVVVWEAVYNFIFLETQKRIEIKRLKKLTNCKIEFVIGDVNEGN